MRISWSRRDAGFGGLVGRSDAVFLSAQLRAHMFGAAMLEHRLDAGVRRQVSSFDQQVMAVPAKWTRVAESVVSVARWTI